MPADQIRNRTVGCKMTDSEYERLSAVVERRVARAFMGCRVPHVSLLYVGL